MVEPSNWTLTGHAGTLAGRTWANPDASWLAVLGHGYGEHIGRYQHVADALVAAGAVVFGHDHVGHGRSAGDRALIRDFEPVVDDEHLVLSIAREANPSLPTVLIGHSMGGMIAARHAQRYPADLTALVLSGPVLGTWQALDLMELDEIPNQPIDPATLSRDLSVGAAYVADPLVWHGPFARETLQALDECLRTINYDHPLGDDLPALWLHGEDDELVPMVDTRTGMDRIRGLRFEEIIYPGARHEVFNETNSAQVLADLTDFVHRTVLVGH
jgi:alpha-beta hydrolase superfamily lysophospholipase